MTDLRRARELRRQGRFAAARGAVGKVLAADPADLDALHLMGRLQADEGRGDLAALILEGVRSHRPDDAHVAASLSRALVGAHDAAGAIGEAERAAALAPGSARAHRARSLAYLQDERHADAREALEHAIELDPSHPGARTRLVELLYAVQDHEAGALAVASLLDVDPDGGFRIQHVAVRLAGAGQVGDARALLLRAIELLPGDPEIEHLLAAHGVGDATRSSDAYVQQHFDRFAESFDETLARTGYRVPEALVGLLTSTVPAPEGGHGTVVDLGCGTGLCGPLLRPVTRRLVGVDLSAGMLDRAREREVYDDLEVAEVTGWCASHPASCDVLVLADVLMYFGDVEPLARAAAVALRPGGVVAASAERAPLPGHHLAGTGRWAHGDDVLPSAALAGGFEPVRSEWTVLRHERGEPVEGNLVLWRLPG